MMSMVLFIISDSLLWLMSCFVMVSSPSHFSRQ